MSTKKELNMRKKIIVPVLVFFVLAGTYVHLFLDANLKFAIRKGLELAGGAEVNVESVNLSIVDGTFVIENLEITDPSKPEYNLVSFEKFNFNVSSVDLLKLKFIVDDASLHNFVFGSKRAHKGWVEELSEEELRNLSDAEKNQPKILRNISKMLLGFNPAAELEKIDLKQLPSVLKANGLKSDINSKNSELSALVAKLPNSSKLSSSTNKISSLGKSQDLKKLQSDLSVLKQSKSEAGSYVKQLALAGGAVTTGVSILNKSIDSLDSNIDGDLSEVLAQLQLPDLEFSGLAKELFGAEIDNSLEKYKAYYNYVEPYLKKTEEKSKAAKSQGFRNKGQRIVFAEERLPLFWLKNAKITTSKETDSYEDKLEGMASNITDALHLTSAPMLVELAGTLQSLDLQGFDLKAFISSEEKGEKYDLRVTVKGVEVEDRVLSESESFNLKIKDSTADVTFGASYYEGSAEVKVKSVFKDVKYDISSDNRKVISTLGPIVKKIKTINLTAVGKGTLEHLDWEISSNLADEIKKGLSKTLNSQIGKVKKSITRKVRDEIGKKKKELYSQVRKMKAKYSKEISEKMKVAKTYSNMVNKKMAEVNKKVESIKKKISNKVKGKATNKAKDLIKSKVPGF
jgi:uncharacterized protein (TIGR03545 family)